MKQDLSYFVLQKIRKIFTFFVDDYFPFQKLMIWTLAAEKWDVGNQIPIIF